MATILIVDDTKVSREILRNLLESEGHEIVGEAVNGAEAVAKYMELWPDIVTMDITMPVLDGIGALKQIKEADCDARVVMLSAAGQNSKIAECLMLGASDFLTKPYDAEQIAGTVSRLISLYE